ncbi:MAG TPA: PadR family transcriptional regulator [Desulfosporosinus sp.]|nr:PadR family transcriptional regulator [Desulfosporosinus sp.]
MDEEMISKFELAIPIDRTIQAELLLLLGQQPSHGYELIQRLNGADFKSGEADPATVYRNLRRMDKDGLIKSHWEVGESGPGRRLYELTPQGLEALKVWTNYLAEQKAKLENFLNTYLHFVKSQLEMDEGRDKP